MTDVDELRRTLEDRAGLAPDGTGIVEAAWAIHRRRRRRRTVATVAAVAVLVAALPLAVAQAGGKRRATPAVTKAPSPTPAYRATLDLTVDLQPGQAAGKMVYGVFGHMQFIMVRPVPGKVGTFGTVLVYDPGALDTTPFLHGDKVQVKGHVAYHTTAFPEGSSLVEAVGWPDPSGAWIVVTDSASLNGMLALGENVRLGVPGRVVTPYHLSYVPPGAEVTAAQIRYGDPTLTDSELAFGGTPPTSLTGGLVLQMTPDIAIQTVNRTDGIDSYQKGAPAPLKIAGHDAWWYTDREPGPLVITQNHAALFVNAGNCQMQITADVTKYPFDELKRIVEGATFRDCTKGSTWVPPLG